MTALWHFITSLIKKHVSKNHIFKNIDRRKIQVSQQCKFSLACKSLLFSKQVKIFLLPHKQNSPYNSIAGVFIYKITRVPIILHLETILRLTPRLPIVTNAAFIFFKYFLNSSCLFDAWHDNHDEAQNQISLKSLTPF